MSSINERVLDPKVPAKVRSRRYSASYKAKIPAEYERLDRYRGGHPRTAAHERIEKALGWADPERGGNGGDQPHMAADNRTQPHSKDS